MISVCNENTSYFTYKSLYVSFSNLCLWMKVWETFYWIYITIHVTIYVHNIKKKKKKVSSDFVVFYLYAILNIMSTRRMQFATFNNYIVLYFMKRFDISHFYFSNNAYFYLCLPITYVYKKNRSQVIFFQGIIYFRSKKTKNEVEKIGDEKC